MITNHAIPASSDERGEWQRRLYQRLRGHPYPLCVFDEAIVPAASLWSGARLYLNALRDTGVVPGDRILIALPPTAAFVQALVACLWEGYTAAIAPPVRTVAELFPLMEQLDVRCAIAPFPGFPGVLAPHGCEGPTLLPFTPYECRLPAMPAARLLLRSSGTSGSAKWIALSDRNLLAVLDSHLPELALSEDSRVLSALPWHHAFGLVLDLLPALLSGAEIVRDSGGGRSAERLLQLAEGSGSTHLSMVPLTVQRLRDVPGGERLLRSLQGGIVGGAPVGRSLAQFLSSTRLRAGYGQTEAGPGIALGAPGQWPGPGYLGTPVGSRVRAEAGGVLAFSGENACFGYWTPDQGIVPIESEWRRTGDIVTIAPTTGEMFFRGRADNTFKLSNGRLVLAGEIEASLCRAMPQIEECVLFSPDGEALTLLWTGEAGADTLALETVRRMLGTLGQRLVLLRRAAADTVPRTAKGDIDRGRLANLWQHEGK